MMFSSNQKLEVTGCLDHKDELYTALEFALKISGRLEGFKRIKNKSKCVYQITDDGRYCIGWAYNEIATGWYDYPFDFDLSIISQIIIQYLDKHQKIEYGGYDGSYSKGFLMRNIEDSLADDKDNIKHPFYGIVEFSPYTCFYSK